MSDKITVESFRAAIDMLEENRAPYPATHLFFEEKMLSDICELLGVAPNLDASGEQRVGDYVIKLWNCGCDDSA